MDFYKYAEMLDRVNGIPTLEIIVDIINEYGEMKELAFDHYERYKMAKESTPILQREYEGEAAKKINNKLANDYFGEIIDTKVGYMFGAPVAFGYDKTAANHKAAADAIERFRKVNNLDDLNAEFCKLAAITGYDAGLCYIGKDGSERVMRIDPWEAVVISKTGINEPEYGLVYFDTWDGKKRVEFYNGIVKFVFEGDSIGLDMEVVETKPHGFKYCPLFGIPNNAELQGDGEKVFSLIDAFDRSLSDMNNEIEQYRLAYMLFVGYEPDEDVLKQMIKNGALYIPDAEDGAGISWLVKDLNPAYVDSHLDRLEANITRFAKHVNFTDAAFGADITGPAMRYKLFALETKSKYFERKHEAAMLYMFKVIGSAWETKGVPFDYALLDAVYSRNIPVNLLDAAQTATTMMAITSKRTALATMPNIDDVDEELDRIAEEKADMVDLDDPDLLDKKDGGDITEATA